jgi:hypothetical protein
MERDITGGGEDPPVILDPWWVVADDGVDNSRQW